MIRWAVVSVGDFCPRSYCDRVGRDVPDSEARSDWLSPAAVRAHRTRLWGTDHLPMYPIGYYHGPVFVAGSVASGIVINDDEIGVGAVP